MWIKPRKNALFHKIVEGEDCKLPHNLYFQRPLKKTVCGNYKYYNPLYMIVTEVEPLHEVCEYCRRGIPILFGNLTQEKEK